MYTNSIHCFHSELYMHSFFCFVSLHYSLRRGMSRNAKTRAEELCYSMQTLYSRKGASQNETRNSNSHKIIIIIISHVNIQSSRPNFLSLSLSCALFAQFLYFHRYIIFGQEFIFSVSILRFFLLRTVFSSFQVFSVFIANIQHKKSINTQS